MLVAGDAEPLHPFWRQSTAEMHYVDAGGFGPGVIGKVMIYFSSYQDPVSMGVTPPDSPNFLENVFPDIHLKKIVFAALSAFHAFESGSRRVDLVE